ncbi:uncharacterized protein LOC129312952 [Prosopis cineraria]|uniref:uncharacterized protein LOC129312952 n=1 Tax=Prosopis cineraria TaxID=364024 RepID=UPI00240F211A|nr:uncharacterized protein LOC129312952 [Prosopis cineraria]
MNQAYNMIIEDEAQRSIAGFTKSSPIEGSAMAVGRGQGRGRGRGRTNSSIECAHYHKWGHTKENCYEIVGYPENYRGNKNKHNPEPKAGQSKTEAANGVEDVSQTVAPTFTQEQYEQIHPLLKKDGQSTVHALTGTEFEAYSI